MMIRIQRSQGFSEYMALPRLDQNPITGHYTEETPLNSTEDLVSQQREKSG